MSTKCSSSPEADLNDVFSAMASSSPVRPDPKCCRRDGNEEDDKEDVREGTAQSLGPNNMEYLQRFMLRKKLRTEQVTDVQVFVQVSRLFFSVLALSYLLLRILRLFKRQRCLLFSCRSQTK